MTNDKIVNLAADWMFKAIEAWQSGDGHPLTCGNDSNHILVGKSKRIPGMDIPILACPECDYEQENVPCVIYTSYLRAEIERLEKALATAKQEIAILNQSDFDSTQSHHRI